MLQALVKHKIGTAISTGKFKPIEDTLTSSVIGTLQYLPDSVFWHLLRKACGDSFKLLPDDIGEIRNIHFWDKLDPKGTYNTKLVEPDVWIETDSFNVIVEAKKTDHSYNNAQYEVQWQNEIISVKNSSDKEGLICIALGGNKDLQNNEISVNNESILIYTASWYNLFDAVQDYLSTSGDKEGDSCINRILSDTIEAFMIHNIFSTQWFESLTINNINIENLDSIWKQWK